MPMEGPHARRHPPGGHNQRDWLLFCVAGTGGDGASISSPVQGKYWEPRSGIALALTWSQPHFNPGQVTKLVSLFIPHFFWDQHNRFRQNLLSAAVAMIYTTARTLSPHCCWCSISSWTWHTTPTRNWCATASSP